MNISIKETSDEVAELITAEVLIIKEYIAAGVISLDWLIECTATAAISTKLALNDGAIVTSDGFELRSAGNAKRFYAKLKETL